MSKKELIKLLKKEQESVKGYDQLMVILEQKKVTKEIGMLKFEYYSGTNLEAKGILSIPLASKSEKNPSEWEKILVGESKFYGFVLDTRGKSLMEIAKGFVKRSFEDSKIQDFLPFGTKK